MYSLINANFSRTYNPSGRQNALTDIKKLLTSRDTAAQNKACGYLIEVISRYNKNSNEGIQMAEYLLDNDITVFLCEATSNLDFALFRSILTCLRLLWRSRQFFVDEHAAHSMTAVLRALAHYASSGSRQPVEACLHFLCDLLNGVSAHKTTSALSHQSAYSAVQLLACLNALSTHISTNPNTILSSALVLHSLISYQPENLTITLSTATALLEVLKKWFALLMGALNHSILVGNGGVSGMFYVVICQIGMDVFGLTRLLRKGNQKADFVHKILTDDHEMNAIKESASQLEESVRAVVSELVVFTKEHQSEISTEEYAVFLKLLLKFFYDNMNRECLPEFCDMMFSKGYLTMLPQSQISRNDVSVRKVSTLVLGEMLKVLADKYLNVNDVHSDSDSRANDIHMGLVELQYGVERPHSIGSQLQKGQPYSLLIYIYFYCQSSENPEEATAPLLPYLVEHILKLPKSFKPPSYIIKALWLVFAMSTVSNGSLKSLDERVYLEKATDRLVTMLYPDPSVYYTHNPAILLWAFTSQRISNCVRMHILSQWFKSEDALPSDLTTQPAVWELLLNILIQNTDRTIVENCMEALHNYLEDEDDSSRQDFAVLIWSMLPSVLSKVLIDAEFQIDKNICYFLELATSLPPEDIDPLVCLKTAVLITAIFSKNTTEHSEESVHHYQYVCLKLALYLLSLANNQNDNRVLLTYTNRTGFLQAVLASADSSDDRAACSALQLLSYVIHYFAKNNYQPKSILQIQTHIIIKSLRRDSASERGASLLQLVYMVLNTGTHSPLALTYEVSEHPSVNVQCNALRALMFRIQLMLCCRDSKNQSSAGWKTLSSIFKHAIVSRNDTKLIALLTSQPWTHTLIHFQLTQDLTQEFLTFTLNWLTLLKITIKKCKETNKIQLCKQSLVIKTMVLMKKNLKVEGDLKEISGKVLGIADEILDCSGIKYN
ncbi:uncharacterized protein LOC142980201 [Anticarsia gemmatalis]|uniref:uncharacterized protein LOC142980201 n=1 Tax=Anticarsia gemmatalis TaxID=129554 RepID=UPI003F76BC16